MTGIHDLFAATATRRPDAAALRVGPDTVTYGDLHDLVLRLAGHLQRSVAVGSGRVGLTDVKSVPTYAAYLALLRLGRTVVPIAADAPVARMATVVREAALDAVLTADQPDSGLGVPVLSLTEAVAAARHTPPLAGVSPAGPDTDAYVLFTSGSTGVPKGIAITHGNVVSYLDQVVPQSGLDATSRVSHTFSLTFDPSVYDMLATWTAGATLVVPGAHDLLAPSRYVQRNELTHWYSVPSVVSLAARAGTIPAGSMPTLRWSGFIGEPFTLAQARSWQAAAPGSVIENVYGPTELTVSCTGFVLPADPADWPSPSNHTVPIGHVYPALQHLVVGPDGRPAQRGELCVRGPQRFAGYLRHTDDDGRFYAGEEQVSPAAAGVPADPALWYRTGDVVEVLDGVLVHAGRLDRQLKVRGYRIEPEEVERVLRGHPGVENAVVTTPADDGLTLVAFVVGSAGRDAALHEHLRQVLPKHLVPSRIVWVDTLPVNDRGKVDHHRVAAMAATAR